ncbi:sensor histidine kinase [Brachybacterium sp. FME24]|uniref:sensor histidine kinase n=1 Tax=Brachybacterium sp. FME24 TaxID=2742605 RepID=UPI0018670EDA|nr:sensor histidine kinase [Brachybacterium sp. FME24]
MAPALLFAAFALATLPVIGRASGNWGPRSGGPSPTQPLPDGTATPDAVAAALVLLTAAALVLRRRRPVTTLIAVTVATTLYLVIGYPYGPVLLGVAVAVFCVARHRPPRVAAGWAAGAFVALLIHLLVPGDGTPGFTGFVPAAAWVALPFSLGLARHLVADARSRARADADESLVQAERLRLAQEVHDVVGHGLAAIQMQADIALHVHETRPGQSEDALRAISAASAEALEELRSTLSSIRPEGAVAPGDTVAPTPGLARLGPLCERVRAAGFAVELEVTGARDPLPTALDLAVYRIVQESLTNVVKHSAHPRAEVQVHRGAEEVEVTVTNQDLHPDEHTAGFGISGMQRRAAQLGGTVTFGAGPQPHTFRLHAVLPSVAPPRQEMP